ncbi:hypothetical protein DPMN_057859 [Dreissena polymorpha]|uniref:Uncharacterized protein n=1 Tax=Dreissena polymorpha TaxID=45954 RepID=A0A9D4C124_DREPO|nr:hypothetical protein DPMN_057859 [Dreissena polymorpha]
MLQKFSIAAAAENNSKVRWEIKEQFGVPNPRPIKCSLWIAADIMTRLLKNAYSKLYISEDLKPTANK